MHKLVLIRAEFFRGAAKIWKLSAARGEVRRRRSVAALIENLGEFALSGNSFRCRTNGDYADDFAKFLPGGPTVRDR